MKINTNAIFFTALVLLFSIIFFEYSSIDVWLQDYLYDFSSGQWFLDRDEKITKLLFYDGIKKALIAFFLLILIAALLFRKTSFVKNYREGLFIVLLSAVLVPLTVGALKATTNIPCPRDLKHYGGTYPHVTLLSQYPENFQQTENVRCYPAGHASGGFALLALTFLFKRKRNRMIVVAAALSIGWAMGIYKMLIGDHFLGHTFVTMILAWLLILIIAKNVHGLSDKFKQSDL